MGKWQKHNLTSQTRAKRSVLSQQVTTRQQWTSVCPLCYLLLNHWTKINRIWCVSFSHEWGVQRETFFCSDPGALRPWGGVKMSNITFNFNYKVILKDLCTKLCVCSHKWKIQSISDGIFSLSPGPCPRGGTLGRWGRPGGQQLFYFKHGQLAYQIDGNDKQNRMQVKVLPYGQTGDLGVRSKGQISLKFDYHVNSKIFVPNFVCVLTNKRYKPYWTEVSICCWGHAPGVGPWVQGGSKT